MRSKRFFVNLSGILLTFVIAFGGIFAVWSRLEKERTDLLTGGGEAEIPVKTEVSKSISVTDVEMKGMSLTQEELRQAVLFLESASEKYPHEPMPGQLSMTEATRNGMAWLEDFFLPRLDMEGSIPEEYRLSCYLWAGNEAEAGDEATDLLSGYWEVSFAADELDAELLLNAVTGQVLGAWIALPFSAGEHPDEESLEGLLADYADSFGTKSSYVISAAKDGETGAGEDWGFRQRLENDRMAVCLEAGDAVSSQASPAESGKGLRFALYLETKPLED